MKILVLGSTGMLGSNLLFELSKESKFKIIATYKDINKVRFLKKKVPDYKQIKFIKLDINKLNERVLKKFLNEIDVVINCIGLIKQKIKNKEDKKKAFFINSTFPKKLNKCKNKKLKIFQIATDCVFSGKKGNYNESDVHDCNDIYGLSKSYGEVNDVNFFNIRCSIIGKEINSNKSLYNWFMKRPKNSKVRGFSNHLWNGVSTKVFSIILINIIKQKIKIPNIFHLVPKNKISKYNLLKFLKNLNQKKIRLFKHKHQIKINRTLSTKYKKLNSRLWNISFKKQLTIESMLKYYI